MSSSLEQLYRTSHLGGTNAGFVQALYEAWLEAPDSVPPDWQRAFQRITDGAGDTAHGPILERFRRLAESGHYRKAYAGASIGGDHKQAGVLKMINAYRVRGHQTANLDPLGLAARPAVPDLELDFHDLDTRDLDTEFDTGSLAADDRMPLRDILDLLQRVYCGSIGSEYMHITDTEQRRWLQNRLEGSGGDFSLQRDSRRSVLEKLTAAEGLERYLHRKYVGQKRFSLEGAEALIPMLYDLIHQAGGQGAREIVMGMAHRGRLNVLVNILGKAPAELFEEFEGKPHAQGNGSGDVKYHLGYSSDIRTAGGDVHIALAFNPSHLEIVDPVVVGSALARQIRREDRPGQQVLPILMHGDAALAGQGVVMELFNMSQARGFAVGGTVHIVINNQIGFTTSNPLDARSTLYCTEVAKMVQAPILHVNADDPEAVLFSSRLALDFRQRFNKDVVVDLVCYRRHGHNEADEPAATQPRMYETIRNLKTVREQFAETIGEDGTANATTSKQLMDDYRDRLDAGEQVADVLDAAADNEFIVDWGQFQGGHWRDETATAIDPEQANELSNSLTTLPEGFELHPRVKQIVDAREKMAADEIPMDWGFAETLAYASLIRSGYGLRLVGQDSGRGTFFHRQAILHDQNTGERYVPLEAIANEPHRVAIIDSLLSEEAVMGFEYGYATADPETLVIWEAQFGDFCNGAQVVIDQFISSGESKWGRLCGLTLFLPHGYEGQGPEHSSARLERFLQLCAEENMQVCVPSLPAQFFHMLRRQMLRAYRKPLVVMTPKSLLRHKASTSQLGDLGGGFQPVIDDPHGPESGDIERVVLCAGKVYFDLAQQREEAELGSVAICRIEQLYPFPDAEVRELLQRYTAAPEVVWCQEEPRNQGAWLMIRERIAACLGDGQSLGFAGRAESASPAVGHYQVHVQQQKQLVNQALGIPEPGSDKQS